jgi:hypothetical protein
LPVSGAAAGAAGDSGAAALAGAGEVLPVLGAAAGAAGGPGAAALAGAGGESPAGAATGAPGPEVAGVPAGLVGAGAAAGGPAAFLAGGGVGMTEMVGRAVALARAGIGAVIGTGVFSAQPQGMVVVVKPCGT